MIESAYGTNYDQISEIGIHDVLVTVSFPRYTKETLEVTKIAKRKGATIIFLPQKSGRAPVKRHSASHIRSLYNPDSIMGSLLSADL